MASKEERKDEGERVGLKGRKNIGIQVERLFIASSNSLISFEYELI